MKYYILSTFIVLLFLTLCGFAGYGGYSIINKDNCPSGYECERIDTSLCYEVKNISFDTGTTMKDENGILWHIWNTEERTFLNNGTEIKRCE